MATVKKTVKVSKPTINTLTAERNAFAKDNVFLDKENMEMRLSIEAQAKSIGQLQREVVLLQDALMKSEKDKMHCRQNYLAMEVEYNRHYKLSKDATELLGRIPKWIRHIFM